MNSVHTLRIAAVIVVLFACIRGSAQTVNVWVTTDNQQTTLQKQAALSFTQSITAGARTVFVDERQTYQTVEGFGASFTDSAAYLLKEKVPPAQLDSVMRSLFDRDAGIGVSFVRNPMGASDLSRSLYSYDDLPAGQSDSGLASFSIAHDLIDVVPLVRQAKQINPQLRIMANPWSPPGWMKTSGSMIGGSLTPSAYGSLANYFVRYIQAYADQGIAIDYVSMQNEPLYVPPDYPGLSLDAPTQVAVLRDYLLPALSASNLTTRVLIYDHNWDRPDYPDTVLSDPVLAGSPQIAGIAWHGYGGTPGVMTTLQKKYPDKGNYETEHSGGTWVTDQVKSDFEEIIQVMRNWGKTYVKWSLALDQTRGPHTGGCGTCNPLVTVNSNNGNVSYNIDYYTLGHFSKFVVPGALRIYSSNTPGFVSAAFRNPDGSKVLVIYNDTASQQAVQAVWGSRSFSYSLPALAGATFTWSGDQDGGYALSATTQRILASSYNDTLGLQTETTADVDGGYDLGFADGGDWAVYKSVDFGTGATRVEARLASAGSGGTLEFHLGSADGLLIASLTVPITGGWQNWATVSAPVSGAAGIADLYVVFKGGSSIGNLNWFQFSTPSSPRIDMVGRSGKNLVVQGGGFAAGAKILVNGQEQRTIADDQSPAAMLTGKKTLKTLTPGVPVEVQVVNPDGGKSNVVQFTK